MDALDVENPVKIQLESHEIDRLDLGASRARAQAARLCPSWAAGLDIVATEAFMGPLRTPLMLQHPCGEHI